MHLKLYSVSLTTFVALGFAASAAAAPFEDGFEGDFPGDAWVRTNLSSSPGSNPNWDAYVTDAIEAHSGDRYVMADYNSVGGGGARTISNWLLSPEVPVVNGVTMTFWTFSANPGTSPDRLQVRLSTAQGSVDVGATDESVGAFTTLLLDINPTLASDGFPSVWTQYTVTVADVPVATTGRFAFRYYVANSGPLGTNGAAVTLDDVVITSPCGNGVLEVGAGEECDDSNEVDGDGCQADCQLPACGDGVVDDGEACDDGNADDGDGCEADCTVTRDPTCGDGVVDESEECDDGNNDNYDGCHANCRLPVCGDGITDAGEECDMTSGSGRQQCNVDCQWQTVGGCDVGWSSAGSGRRGALVVMLGLVGVDVWRRRRRARRAA